MLGNKPLVRSESGCFPYDTTDLDHVAEAYKAMDERRAIKSLIRVGKVARR